MKAITTQYSGPTNARGARIKAYDADHNSASVPYPYELSGQDCHDQAVKALCHKMNWHGRLVAGSVLRGYVYVWLPDGCDSSAEALQV